MGAACCAGSAVSGGSSGGGSLLALPLALFELSPQLSLFLAVGMAVVGLVGYVLLLLLTPSSVSATSSELQYESKEGTFPLPTLADEASVQLSVVVPAYNERLRLPIMLDEAVAFLESLRASSLPLVQGGEALEKYEILIVDDGSTDATHQVALEYAKAHPKVDMRIVRLQRNRGKGGAVRHGVLHSRGETILFADADGATRFADLAKLAKELERIRTKNGHAIVVGSRAHMVKSDAVVKRSWVRNLLMHGFHIFLSLLLRPPAPRIPVWKAEKKGHTVQKLPRQPVIKDTQCGFKLFTRQSARTVFPYSHIDRWIFDVELLILAEMAGGPGVPGEGEELLRLGLPVGEVAVQWHEVGGSKIDLVKDSIGMALDLLVIRANYATGRWKAPSLCS